MLMNKCKSFIIKCLLSVYTKKRNFWLRSLIKKSIGQQRIKIKYGGFNLMVGLESSIESNILFDEYSEKTILKIINYFALKNYNFVDVGANIGLHTLTAANANSNIEVFSFEPEPNNFYKLIKNISINDCLNIRPFKLGLGESSYINQMNINQGWNNGKHSMKVHFGTNQKNINIPVSLLDNFKENISNGPLIIKIDVEGYEKEVIEGATKFLNNLDNSILIIELLEEINGLLICKEIKDMLIKLNFKEIYKINSNEVFELVDDYYGSGDYIFLKGNTAIEDFNRLKNYA
ncbi:FkbM family methyltransferase [Flavobacterium bizetiae]|nr:FkbM family methyltransferase [Flavobacterium bizetiae]CAD5350590.1 hypothetical protein FLA105534_04581 [Flavobacterium bizetiae]